MAQKPWTRVSARSDREDFNEYYTLYEQCDIQLRDIIDLLRPFKTICCPCDSEKSNIVKWLQDNTEAEIIYFDDLDINSEEAREIMSSCDCVITNPPYESKHFIPFFLWLNDNNIEYYIWGPNMLSSNRRGLIQKLKNIHIVDAIKYKDTDAFKFFEHLWKAGITTHFAQGPPTNVFRRPDNSYAVVDHTIYYTSLNVEKPDYNYKPAKNPTIETYNGIRVFNFRRHIPKDYYDWMYIPVTALPYIGPYEYDEEGSRACVNGHYKRLLVRRIHE